MSTERWSDIPGYDGDYRISSIGQIRSFKKYPEGRILRHNIHKRYKVHMIVLCRDNKVTHRSIHSLVMETFGPPKPEGRVEILHNDGDTENNSIDNLRWGTHLENVHDSMKHGTFNWMIGEDHVCAKIKEDDVVKIRSLIKEGLFQKDIAKMFGIRQQSISKIITGKRWKHVV